MKISRYFRDLRKAYEAELDDLTSDSGGKDVLRKRLDAKRKEMGFLVQMMEAAPEMVAVVFHRAFRFVKHAPLQALVGQGEEQLPEWDSLTSAGAVTLEPWAENLVDQVLQDPFGARFLSLAAGLEYLQHHANAAPVQSSSADSDDEEVEDDYGHEMNDGEHLSADDARGPVTDRSREEASDHWLSDIGFEPKK
ncbi:hypothetical protein [Simplicispira psychrophila]|uniref:hypothetical protein n=1 Tax=Simplicispira psychrophila TaxID=80882 RepID=UPI0004847BD2|nr:hypothetical protein [Simplicispira psychrophila]